MAAFFSKLDEIVQQLKDLGEQISERQLITKVLRILPQELSHFSSAWDSTAAGERTLVKLRERLMVEEMRISNASEQNEVQQSAFSARTAKKTTRTKEKRVVKCYECGVEGHFRRDCPNLSTKKEEKEVQSFYALSAIANGSSDWYLDSGATYHLCSNRSWFANYRRFDEKRAITAGNGESMIAIGRGDVYLSMYDGINWNDGMLRNVYHVPDVIANLVSAGQLTDNGFGLSMKRDGCKIHKEGLTAAVGIRKRNLYKLLFRMKSQTKSVRPIESKCVKSVTSNRCSLPRVTVCFDVNDESDLNEQEIDLSERDDEQQEEEKDEVDDDDPILNAKATNYLLDSSVEEIIIEADKRDQATNFSGIWNSFIGK